MGEITVVNAQYELKFIRSFPVVPHMSRNFLINSKKNQIIWMLKKLFLILLFAK